jgi:ribokinase
VLIAAVGADAEGDDALEALRARGVQIEGVLRRPGAPTGRALVVVDDSGENAIVVVPGANGTLTPDDISGRLAAVGTGDVVVLQNEVPPAVNRAAARIARSAGATAVWNAAPSPRARHEIPEDIDILVVNEHELEDIAHLIAVDAQPRALAVADALNTTVVCTLGSRGAEYTEGGRLHAIPSRSVDVRDTTGAGDATVGYLAANLGGSLHDALSVATVAGALTVTRDGASDSIPLVAEVRRAQQSTYERTAP